MNVDINNIFEEIIKKKRLNSSLFPIEEEIVSQSTKLEKKLKRRKISFLAESCLFDHRLYIGSDGSFHICEKMNNRFPIGNNTKGFDFDRMRQIAQEFIETVKKACLECDARFLCNKCYIHFAGEGSFKINPDFCEMNKKKLQRLGKLIELKQQGIL